MIENKKLFIISLVLLGLASIGLVRVLIFFASLESFDMLGTSLGIFYIVPSVLGGIIYSLMYKSLKKTNVTKKIYCVILIVVTILFIIGITTLLGIY